MASMFSYLITMLGGVFWIIRTVITVCYTMEKDIGIVPLNPTIEIILLFLTIVFLIFIVKRNIFGALAYFVAYGLYFGDDLYQGIMKISSGDTEMLNYVSLFLSFIGVLIPFLTVMDIFLNKERKGSTKDEKTDWFFTNKEYDRKHDDRADENQYKF